VTLIAVWPPGVDFNKKGGGSKAEDSGITKASVSWEETVHPEVRNLRGNMETLKEADEKMGVSSRAIDSPNM